jgi:hypothetical protein
MTLFSKSAAAAVLVAFAALTPADALKECASSDVDQSCTWINFGRGACRSGKKGKKDTLTQAPGSVNVNTKEMCTSMCDNDADCHGFEWYPKRKVVRNSGFHLTNMWRSVDGGQPNCVFQKSDSKNKWITAATGKKNTKRRGGLKNQAYCYAKNPTYAPPTEAPVTAAPRDNLDYDNVIDSLFAEQAGVTCAMAAGAGYCNNELIAYACATTCNTGRSVNDFLKDQPDILMTQINNLAPSNPCGEVASIGLCTSSRDDINVGPEVIQLLCPETCSGNPPTAGPPTAAPCDGDCCDGVIPGGSGAPAYGYQCIDWAADYDGNGIVDCAAADDAMNLDPATYVDVNYTKADLIAIRAACPASCDVCIPDKPPKYHPDFAMYSKNTKKGKGKGSCVRGKFNKKMKTTKRLNVGTQHACAEKCKNSEAGCTSFHWKPNVDQVPGGNWRQVKKGQPNCELLQGQPTHTDGRKPKKMQSLTECYTLKPQCECLADWTTSSLAQTYCTEEDVADGATKGCGGDCAGFGYKWCKIAPFAGDTPDCRVPDTLSAEEFGIDVGENYMACEWTEGNN